MCKKNHSLLIPDSSSPPVPVYCWDNSRKINLKEISTFLLFPLSPSWQSIIRKDVILNIRFGQETGRKETHWKERNTLKLEEKKHTERKETHWKKRNILEGKSFNQILQFVIISRSIIFVFNKNCMGIFNYTKTQVIKT